MKIVKFTAVVISETIGDLNGVPPTVLGLGDDGLMYEWMMDEGWMPYCNSMSAIEKCY